MRKILFRGKRLDNGKWVYGNLVKLKQDYFITSQQSVDDFLIDKDTVGQFTGLLDKNGNKIFEGDIIKRKNNTITEIRFGEFQDTKYHYQVGFHQVYWDVDDDWWDGRMNGTMDDVKDSEIIGNIHDNGDLYKESKGEIK